MSHDQKTVPESSYPSLEHPTFKSQIPEYLLRDATDADKHIMAQLSVLTQFSEWSTKAHISTMESVRKTNGRLIKAEDDIVTLKGDKKSVKVGWKVICFIGGAIVTVASTLAAIYEALHG